MSGGEYIKKMRIEKNLSFRRLAIMSGVSHQFIKLVEDHRSAIAYDKLVRILHALGVTMYDFLHATNYRNLSRGLSRGQDLNLRPLQRRYQRIN